MPSPFARVYCWALDIPKTWFSGTVFFFTHPESFMTAIVPALDSTGIIDSQTSDLVCKNIYLEVVNSLFRQAGGK